MDTGTSIRECIWDANEDALVADGFDYNVVGAYVGDNTPLFATILKDLKQIYPCS